MKLIDEIVDGAVNSSTPLADLLRRCLVAATRIGNNQVRQWAISELNGYTDRAVLPNYRIVSTHARGTFIGHTAQLNEQPLPASVLAPEHRHWATTAHLMQPVAVYELATRKDNDLGSQWPGDMVAHYQSKFYDDLTLSRARTVIPNSAVAGLVEAVRNKLLEFALELQREFGQAEDASVAVASEKVDRAFTAIILGGKNIIASSVSGGVQQIETQTVIRGNFASLAAVLSDVGVSDEECNALKVALAEDELEGGQKTFGSRTRTWLQKAVGYVGTGAAKVTGGLATSVLTKAIETYLGLD